MRILFFGLILVWLSGCSRHSGSSSAGRNPDTVFLDNADTTIHPDTIRRIEIGNNYWTKNHCPRGIPAPTLNRQNPNITGSSFELLDKKGVEKASLFSGDSLIIENSGCEYFELTYTLKIKEGNPISVDKKFWFQKASDLLLGLQDSEAPFDFRSMSAAVNNLASDPASTFGKEYPVGNKTGFEIVQALVKGKTASLVFKIFTGPM